MLFRSVFGLHGATALGWIMLEGSGKHSNTARILDLSRDQAKVFNYSRIPLLLRLQANADMLPEQA